MPDSQISDPRAHAGAIGELARWCSAHRRLVLLAWLLLLPSGHLRREPRLQAAVGRLLAARSAGLRDRQEDRRKYGNGGDNDPAIAVVTVPPARRSPATGADRARVRARSRDRDPRARIVDYARTGDQRFITATGARRSRSVHAAGEELRRTEDPARIARALAPPLPWRPRRTDRAQQLAAAAHQRPRRSCRDADRRRRRARRAGVRVRVDARAGAAADRGGLDPHDAAGRARPHLHRQRLVHRAVPRRAGRPRRRDRLLAADRHPLARGARPRARQRARPWSPRWRPPAARSSFPG